MYTTSLHIRIQSLPTVSQLNKRPSQDLSTDLPDSNFHCLALHNEINELQNKYLRNEPLIKIKTVFKVEQKDMITFMHLSSQDIKEGWIGLDGGKGVKIMGKTINQPNALTHFVWL